MRNNRQKVTMNSTDLACLLLYPWRRILITRIVNSNNRNGECISVCDFLGEILMSELGLPGYPAWLQANQVDRYNTDGVTEIASSLATVNNSYACLYSFMMAVMSTFFLP